MSFQLDTAVKNQHKSLSNHSPPHLKLHIVHGVRVRIRRWGWVGVSPPEEMIHWCGSPSATLKKMDFLLLLWPPSILTYPVYPIIVTLSTIAGKEAAATNVCCSGWHCVCLWLETARCPVVSVHLLYINPPVSPLPATCSPAYPHLCDTTLPDK